MKTRHALTLIAALATTTPALAQLTPPPGTVTDTNRVREQADARTPVSAPTAISAPGSYYLTQNISISIGAAITIEASNVTLDLNGFNVSGPTAISIADGARRVIIRNGTIDQSRQFVAGIAISGELATEVAVEDLRIDDAGTGSALISASDPAIILGANARVERVTVTNPGAGIDLPGASGIVRDCLIDQPRAFGIRVEGSPGSGSVVESCVVEGAGTIGIIAGSATTIRKCRIDAADRGIDAGSRTTISECDVRDAGVGIQVDDGSLIERCSVTGGSFALALDFDNTVRDCTVTSSSVYAVTGLAKNVVDGCHFVNTDDVNRGFPAIELGSGSTIRDTVVRGWQSAVDAGTSTNISNCVFDAGTDGSEVRVSANSSVSNSIFNGVSLVLTGRFSQADSNSVIRADISATQTDAVVTRNRISDGSFNVTPGFFAPVNDLSNPFTNLDR